MSSSLVSNQVLPTPQYTVHLRHATWGIAASVAILFTNETSFYDVMGLSEISSLPLVGFCWTVDGKG